jgi:hypothetical protein
MARYRANNQGNLVTVRRSGTLSLLMLSDSFGLNKAARLRAEQEKRSDLEQAPLNPRFPYEVMAFDDKYFMAEPSDAHDPAQDAKS